MTAPGRWLRKCALLVGCSLASLHAPAALPATENLQAGEQPPQVGETDPGYAKWSGATKYNKSWIAIDWSSLKGPLTEGDKIEVPVEYSLDPSEHTRRRRSSSKRSAPACPSRTRRSRSASTTRSISITASSPIKIEPGRGRHVFPLTIPRASPQNAVAARLVFNDSRGKRWPWDVRAERGSCARADISSWRRTARQSVHLRRTGPRHGAAEERQDGRAKESAEIQGLSTTRRRWSRKDRVPFTVDRRSARTCR